jgi:hypothetical protein
MEGKPVRRVYCAQMTYHSHQKCIVTKPGTGSNTPLLTVDKALRERAINIVIGRAHSQSFDEVSDNDDASGNRQKFDRLGSDLLSKLVDP